MQTMIEVDELVTLREAYDELKANNATLSGTLAQQDRVINRLKYELQKSADALTGNEKLLRMQTHAAVQMEREVEALKRSHEHKLTRMADEYKARLIGAMFISFSAALAAFGLIYIAVRAAFAGWI